MAKKKKPAKRSSDSRRLASTPSSDAALPSRFLTEQVLRDVHRALGNRKFKNMDELNSHLKTLLGPGLQAALKHAPPPTPQKEAQDLAYRAMEAEDAKQAGLLARQALEKDPDCVDALITLAEVSSRSHVEFISGLEKAVQAGERSLGASFFAENKGHFWGILETRPYMRARFLLADALSDGSRVSEALKHYEALLELNPNDNQGVRDTLLGRYLETDNLVGARRLLSEFSEDASAVFEWGRTLERLLSADSSGAAKALKRARRDNSFVELYLSGKKKLPPYSPDMYSLGSDEEALFCMEMVGDAWALHPEALLWLLAQLAPAGTPSLFSKKGASA